MPKINKKKLNEALNMPVYVFESLDSTSSYARELDFNAEALVIAEAQSKGRGRIGHEFYSPKGGLYFSFAFKDNRQLGDLTVKLGPLVRDVLEKHSGCVLSVKGVNDIMKGTKKVCGILCEHILDKYIVGIGINCGDAAFPDGLSEIAVSISLDSREETAADIIKGIKSVIDR